MRRITLVIALGVVMAAMMALTVGSALAKDTQPKPETYIDTVKAEQYLARGPSAANPVGIGMFRGESKDLEGDRDPGLTAEVDARITYSGVPGPGVETRLTGGTWILCSKFTAPPRDPITRALIEPECPPNSAISLQGTVVPGGTAEWDTNGGYAVVPTPGGPILVYAGQAKVEADFINVSGTADRVSVSGGTGTFEGTLHHQPLLEDKPPMLEGTLELKF